MPLGLRLWVGVFTIYGALTLSGQTTQGLIRGDVRSQTDGSPLEDCQITLSQPGASGRRVSRSGSDGEFSLVELSPGSYILRIECKGYQAQELHSLELRVASQLRIDFRMRPLDQVWEDHLRRSVFLPKSSVLIYYGPDVDTSRTGNFEGDRGLPGALDPTLSQVVDERLLRNLPLAGRDAYTLLALQPGVTSDSGTTRSLGLSVNGQRPSASNFMLDGLGNNDVLSTGPLSPLPPEFLGEYRVTTNSFSAEFGGTSGYLANAITRSGSNARHGIAYVYGRHNRLNAYGHPGVASSQVALPNRAWEPGVSVGGPIRKEVLFASASLELGRYHSESGERVFAIPTRSYVKGLSRSSVAYQLLSRFTPPEVADGPLWGELRARPPLSVERFTAVPRVDWLPGNGKHRLLTRLAAFRLTRPDFNFSPYAGFSVPLKRRTESIGADWIVPLGPQRTNVFRAGFSRDLFSAERPFPEVPLLVMVASAQLPEGLALPGARSPYSYRNRSRDVEIIENFSWLTHRHFLKAGGGYRLRYIDGLLASYRDGSYTFLDASSLASDMPFSVALALERNSPVMPVLPAFDRTYRQGSWYAFLQDNWRLTRRLAFSLGLRAERYGGPVNVGSEADQRLLLGAGGNHAERLAAARIDRTGHSRALYETRTVDWAVRSGLTYALRTNGGTIVRGSYGVFYDRPFDNIWQTARNNAVVQLSTVLPAGPHNYLNPTEVLNSLTTLRVLRDFPEVTLFPERLVSPAVQSGFAGVQHVIGANWMVEGNLMASSSGELITTDRWNRQASLPGTTPPSTRRLNPNLPDVLYRANEGRSNYRAFSALVRYRSSKYTWQATYTLSRTKDNQSDPVLGDFFDLGFSGAPFTGKASFTRQFDPETDWGNADFDQRHNVTFFGLAELPGWLRGWHVGGLGALRSGFPFTVEGSGALTTPPLLHNPANLVDPSRVWAARSPARGGVRLLNAEAFADAGNQVGDSGRNRFHGPGSFNLDVSLNRRFRLARLGESVFLGFRIDVFNALNHANPGNPVAYLGDPDFGISYKGRLIKPGAFRVLEPTIETGRQVQLSFRVEF